MCVCVVPLQLCGGEGSQTTLNRKRASCVKNHTPQNHVYYYYCIVLVWYYYCKQTNSSGTTFGTTASGWFDE